MGEILTPPSRQDRLTLYPLEMRCQKRYGLQIDTYSLTVLQFAEYERSQRHNLILSQKDTVHESESLTAPLVAPSKLSTVFQQSGQSR